MVLLQSHPKKSHCTCEGPHYKVPIIDSYEKNHIVHMGDPVTRFPSLTVIMFPVHMAEPHYTVPIIDSAKAPTFTSYCTCRWTPLQGSHIPYKVWGDHKSH